MLRLAFLSGKATKSVVGPLYLQQPAKPKATESRCIAARQKAMC